MHGLITKECNWCYVDESSFKKNLRSVLSGEKLHQKNAKVLGKHIREKFSKEKVFQMYEDVVSQVPQTTQPIQTFNIEVDKMFDAISGNNS